MAALRLVGCCCNSAFLSDQSGQVQNCRSTAPKLGFRATQANKWNSARRLLSCIPSQTKDKLLKGAAEQSPQQCSATSLLKTSFQMILNWNVLQCVWNGLRLEMPWIANLLLPDAQRTLSQNRLYSLWLPSTYSALPGSCVACNRLPPSACSWRRVSCWSLGG